MTVEELSYLAANEYGLPGNTPLEERALYGALYVLYAKFKKGILTQEEGNREKQKAVYQYGLDCREREQAFARQKRQLDFWQNIERAANAYRREPSTENADRLLEAVYGVGRKERGKGP